MAKCLQAVAAEVASGGCVAETTVTGEGVIQLGGAQVELNKRRGGRGGSSIRMQGWGVAVVEGTEENRVGARFGIR